ncbi:MAG TPA: PIN domain-containing protein [Solirubrobacteraceae bacterium]|nr:PIN domain-containing protein [Solirubrobacteraceae bacterium]
METSTVNRVFIDTGAFVALRNRAEREHELARSTLAALVEERALLFTSNYVFAETYTALLVRLGRDEAIEWGKRFHAGNAIELIRVEPEVEREAWSILEAHTDKEWSYVDATSFALIEREDFTAAFAFDRHFAQRGLRVLPGP